MARRARLGLKYKSSIKSLTMPPKQPKQLQAFKLTLEILPHLAAFSSAFFWLFFRNPAPQKVGQTFLWHLPILTPTLFAFTYNIGHGCRVMESTNKRTSTFFNSWSYHSTLCIHLARSSLTCAVLFLDVSMIALCMLLGLVEKLDPLTDEKGESNPGEVGRWLILGFLLLCFSSFG
ncbi:hypothetical protein B0J14DRAFT_573679 [Halenospora varia]|nr:hypothetical protein B0J14DRAFT_573679 [Halenospora varia]